MKSKKHNLNWIPDLPDHRDKLFTKRSPNALPTSVDLRPHASPIEDQGDLGSCSSYALLGVLEYLENKEHMNFTELSHLFLYYNERVLEDTVDQDAGAMLRDGIKTLASQGVCPELMWKYNIKKFKTKPSQICYTEALNYIITSYQRIKTLEDMKHSLALGYPFVCGLTIFESFESDEVAASGIVPMPSTSESCLGGHALSCFGFDDVKQIFIVRNSWGKDWGMEGYCEVPYAYLTNPDLADDFWNVEILK